MTTPLSCINPEFLRQDEGTWGQNIPFTTEKADLGEYELPNTELQTQQVVTGIGQPSHQVYCQKERAGGPECYEQGGHPPQQGGEENGEVFKIIFETMREVAQTDELGANSRQESRYQKYGFLSTCDRKSRIINLLTSLIFFFN